jgi:hypothetical protein
VPLGMVLVVLDACDFFCVLEKKKFPFCRRTQRGNFFPHVQCGLLVQLLVYDL